MGLIHPGILAGLLAIAVPIAIHFIRSRKFERVEIGALRFLRVAIRERRRWRRIEDWPLLLARIAAVALLTLLFARPFLPEREKITPGELEAIVLVDASGSVSGAHFEKVRAAVAQTLADIPAGAKVTVATFADDVRPLEGAQLDALRSAPGARTDYARAVNWTLDRIAQSDCKHAQVHFISDLQRAALPTLPPRVWPANARATVVPISPAGTWNAALSKVELLTPYAAEEAELEVTVVLSGEVPEAAREVHVQIEGQPPMSQDAGVKSGALRFRWAPGGEPIVRGVASLTSRDAFPADNQRPFAARLTPPKRVRLIEGGTPVTPFEGEAYFADKALKVSGKEHGQSPFASEVKLDVSDVEDTEAIAFCNVAAPAEGDPALLVEFVQNGGALAFFLGGRTDPEQLAVLAASGLFPGKIEPVETPVPRRIDSWERKHPMLTRFDGEETGDLRGLVLRDAFAIEAGPEWKILAQLDNGHPALLARELGKGRVLVFANPLTREWSELPAQRLFVPLVKEWFAWLTRVDVEDATPREIASGFHEERAPGVYEEGERLAVVAPDPAEMDVVVADEAAARRALGLPDEKAVAAAPEPAGLPKFRERQNELWPWFVLALLALLLFENHLADRRTQSP